LSIVAASLQTVPRDDISTAYRIVVRVLVIFTSGGDLNLFDSDQGERRQQPHKVARQILKRAGCYSVHSGLTGRARQERARHGFMA
jgi:hypothetical protein